MEYRYRTWQSQNQAPRTVWGQFIRKVEFFGIAFIFGGLATFFLFYLPLDMKCHNEKSHFNVITNSLIKDVQHLEDESSFLLEERRVLKDSITQQRAQIKVLCSHQLFDQRKLVNECIDKKAKFEIHNKQLLSNVEDFRNELSMMTNKFTRSQTDYKNLAELKRKLEKEVERLSTLLDKTKKSSDPKIGRDNDIKQKKVLTLGEL